MFKGLESHDATKEWDSKIFTLGLLLSTYFVYNTSGTYTRDDLEKMSFITQISSKIQKRANTQMSVEDYPELLWICRNYSFDIKSDDDASKALNEFLKKSDNDSDGIKNTKEAVSKSFNKVNGFYLPTPDLQHTSGTPTRKILLSIDQYNWKELKGEFVNFMNKLCRKIKDEVSLKKVNKCKLKGFMFADYIRKIVECLNNDQNIYVVDMLDVIIKMNASRELDRIINKYSHESALVFKNFPIKWETMQLAETKIHNLCINELKEIIEGPYYEEFQTRFEKQIQDKATNSGLFLHYIKKNTDSIKMLAEDALQEIKNIYKQQMQDKFINKNLPIEWNNFENSEVEISTKLFSFMKNKLKGFTEYNGEIIVDTKNLE